MASDGHVILRGLAHRGACDPEVAEFVAGAALAATTLELHPHFNMRNIIGDAEVEVRDNGDVAIEAHVSIGRLEWIVDFPFFALTISDPDDGPREIIQIAVTSRVADPLQLPYRIINSPTQRDKYEIVVVVDEKHDAPIQLSDDGSVHPMFDPNKSHVELRHRTEYLREALPDAIARGFGFEDWAAVEESHEWDNPTESTVYGVLHEVLGTLR